MFMNNSYLHDHNNKNNHPILLLDTRAKAIFNYTDPDAYIRSPHGKGSTEFK